MNKLRSRQLPTKHKRAIVIISIFLVVLLLGYAEIIRPTQDAKAYVGHLDDSSKPLQECFKKLSGTTQLDLYYAPDISLAQKRKDTATILKQIDTCRTELKEFNTDSHELINLHLSGYVAPYRQAKVYQRQAFDIVGQSNDVLDQYAMVATFLSAYYDHLIAYTTYTQDLQGNKYYLGDAQLTTMHQQAEDLRKRASQIQELDAPAEFSATQLDTANMFTAAATGFDNVVNGYRYGNNYTTEAGYKAIDQANATYDSHVINLPFEELTKSYIPKQVNQLPAKVENLLTSSSE